MHMLYGICKIFFFSANTHATRLSHHMLSPSSLEKKYESLGKRNMPRGEVLFLNYPTPVKLMTATNVAASLSDVTRVLTYWPRRVTSSSLMRNPGLENKPCVRYCVYRGLISTQVRSNRKQPKESELKSCSCFIHYTTTSTMNSN